MAVLNRVYSPLRTQFSMDVVEGTLTQEYDANNKIYTPDRRIRPTAVLPVCSITDPSGMIEDGIVNRYITDIKWYENGNKDSNVISPTSIHYKIDYSSDTNNRGRITIYKNVNSDNPIALFFTANYADIVNGKVRRKVSFWGTVVLSSSVSASSPIVLKTETLRGTKYNPLSNLKYMTLSADLYSGNTIIPAAFWWYKKENGQENLITDYVGHNLRELQVPSSCLKIGSLNNYVCKVQDCRQNLTDVRNEYLNEELDKISDYPRNLLAKQYFLDLNDEIKPGVVTEGEDADGKYICVPKPFALRTYVGGNEQRDLFSGKMSFKENTAYVLRVVGKYVSEIESQWGFAFIIAYTDGTASSALRFDYKANKKTEAIYISDSGKTISHISCTYGFDIPSYIYGIQITEEYNYNLLEGDTEEVTIDGGTSNSKAELILISKNLKVGGKYTVSADDIDSTSNSDRAILFQAGNINGSVSNNIYLSRIRKVSTLTVTEKYDVNTPIYLYLYANDAGGSAGNKVTYKNVQLLEGEYAWNVLGKDIDELTVEAGESSNGRIGILIQNKLTVGGKYTITVDDVINLKGEETKYTILIQQNIGGALSQISNTGVITQNNKSIILTINDKYIPDDDPIITLFIYAGLAGSTAGNTVQFKNVRLLYGETVLPSMPSYTPHFIPSAPDIEVASEAIQLPEGYRPDVQGKTINHEFALTSEMPAYNVKVVTPYGDDSDVISIPNNVKLFPAWIQVDVAGIGTLDNPERYFSADWGNGLKGMNVLLDADDIGLGVQEVEPDVVEGMEHVKYGLAGYSSAPIDNLEEIKAGMRFVFEDAACIVTSNRRYSIRLNGYGVYSTLAASGNLKYGIIFGGVIYYVDKTFSGSYPHRVEFTIGDSLETSIVVINGIEYTPAVNVGNSKNNQFYVESERIVSLIEIYQDDTLIHKWDFEGSTSADRLSDKAETENKISMVMGNGSEFIPV